MIVSVSAGKACCSCFDGCEIGCKFDLICVQFTQESDTLCKGVNGYKILCVAQIL